MSRLISLFSLFLILISPVLGIADNCKLVNPIDLGNINLLEDGKSGGIIYNPNTWTLLTNVVFYEAPKFNDPSDYDPVSDILEIGLSNVEVNGMFLNLLVASVYAKTNDGLYKGLSSIGFSSNYIGSTIITGEVQQAGNLTTYSTKNVARYTEPQHSPNDAITELKVEVLNKKLVSLKLTHPVFKVWKIGEYGTRYVAFTGENQELCLKQAKLTNPY